jgi:hypothetical protein
MDMLRRTGNQLDRLAVRHAADVAIQNLRQKYEKGKA